METNNPFLHFNPKRMFSSVAWSWAEGFSSPWESYPRLFCRVIRSWSQVFREIMSHLYQARPCSEEHGNLMKPTREGNKIYVLTWQDNILLRFSCTIRSAFLISVTIILKIIQKLGQSSMLFWHLELKSIWGTFSKRVILVLSERHLIAFQA